MEVMIMTFKALSNLGREYLRDRLLLYEPVWPARSLNDDRLKKHLQYKRAFSVARLRLWKSLLLEVKTDTLIPCL